MSKKDAAEKYFKLGEQKYNKKDYQGAIADLDKVIELNPKYFDAYNNRGVVKGKLKQQKKLLQILKSHKIKSKRCTSLLQPRRSKKNAQADLNPKYVIASLCWLEQLRLGCCILHLLGLALWLCRNLQ